MRRTNIYLPDDRLRVLRQLGEERGAPVSVLVREAIDAWLERLGARVVGEDEWQQRFDALLARRRKVAARLKPRQQAVDRDVARAIQEVRRGRAAARR